MQIEQPGETLVPADKLRDIVRESVDDTLSIEIAGDNADHQGPGFALQDLHAKGRRFSARAGFRRRSRFRNRRRAAQAAHRPDALRRGEGSTRYAFNGVLVVAKGKKISLVSTDGRRLAQAKGDLVTRQAPARTARKAIIPTKALQLIDKLIDDPEEAVGVPDRARTRSSSTPAARR